MTRYRVSTTALAVVHVDVSADDREHALEVASEAPRSHWVVGGLFGDVDVDDESDVGELEAP